MVMHPHLPSPSFVPVWALEQGPFTPPSAPLGALDGSPQLHTEGCGSLTKLGWASGVKHLPNLHESLLAVTTLKEAAEGTK